MTARTERPRHYWVGVPDAELIVSRDEYRTTDDEFLLAVADEIDDDLERRKVARAQGWLVP